MIAPSGACANVPRNATSASLRTQRGSAGVASDASHATSVAAIVSALTILFPNSMNEW